MMSLIFPKKDSKEEIPLRVCTVCNEQKDLITCFRVTGTGRSRKCKECEIEIKKKQVDVKSKVEQINQNQDQMVNILQEIIQAQVQEYERRCEEAERNEQVFNEIFDKMENMLEVMNSLSKTQEKRLTDIQDIINQNQEDISRKLTYATESISRMTSRSVSPVHEKEIDLQKVTKKIISDNNKNTTIKSYTSAELKKLTDTGLTRLYDTTVSNIKLYQKKIQLSNSLSEKKKYQMIESEKLNLKELIEQEYNQRNGE